MLKRIMKLEKKNGAYFVHGPAIPENKVDGAFNVTFLEVMPPCVVTKSVLCPIKSTA